MMVALKLKPIDVLMFRDGRPFNIGVDLAFSMFYPYPHTTSGALRKLFGEILNISSESWNEILGDWKSTPLKFTGPFFYLEDSKKILVKAPMVLMKGKKDKDQKVKDVLKPVESSLIDISKTSKNGVIQKILWTSSPEALEPAGGFVYLDELLSKLEKGVENLKDIEIISSEKVGRLESRVHIRTENKTAAQKSGKFSIRYLRLEENVSFIVFVEKGEFERWEDLLKELEKRHVIRLGGENRKAVVENLEDEEILKVYEKLTAFEKSTSNARIFITPFILEREMLENLKVSWAVTSKVTYRRSLNRRGETFKLDLSHFTPIYEPGSVFEFENFEEFKNLENFSGFRKLGYNTSLGVSV